MDIELLRSPVAFLEDSLRNLSRAESLRSYEHWWRTEGVQVSDAIDRAGTPWLRMHDKNGARVDEILYPPDYWRMLRRGYEEGLLWRAFDEGSLVPFFELLYIVAYFDPGLACPYTVSMSTAVPLSKYADPALRQRFLPNLLRRDGTVWQGATWMTEIKGGSDLGASVETTARPAGESWQLAGDKYFASNAGAELAVVAARDEGDPRDVRSLKLFLVPRFRGDGKLNYCIRRLKDKIATRSVPTGEIELRDSEAYLLGQGQPGIYLILEVLNVSRVANSVGALALAQRAISDALAYAQSRRAFGKPVIEHPLLKRQFEERTHELRAAFALAWEAVRLLNEVWQERPPYSERYHMFRLVAHLAKYWTAEFAAQAAKWAMEVHGGIGTLQEFGAERWLREAMILAIWEGTAHRQILDGLEVMERKKAHQLLFDHLSGHAHQEAIATMRRQIDELLALPDNDKQANAEAVFRDLAMFTGEALAVRAAETAFGTIA